jgi:hypothetical protein
MLPEFGCCPQPASRPAKRLRFYAEPFRLAEVDASCYALRKRGVKIPASLREVDRHFDRGSRAWVLWAPRLGGGPQASLAVSQQLPTRRPEMVSA